MNRTDRLERLDWLERDLASWFGETAAPRVPDYTDDIVQLTAGLRQRPGWSFPERWIRMSVITLGRRTFRPVPWRTIGVLALIGLVLALGLVAYVGSRPKVPPPFGLAGNGLIAYGTGGDIVVVDPVTGDQRTVVGGTEVDAYPTFSLDGKRIAFERNVSGGGTEVFASDVSGGASMQLMQSPVDNVYGLQWSPDGTELAFINGDLWIVKSDGSGAAPLAIDAYAGGFPMWRPGSGHRQIMFFGTVRNVTGHYLVNDDGTGLHLLFASPTDEPTLAMWMPSGDRIVVTRREPGPGGAVAYRTHVVSLDASAQQIDDRTVGPDLERAWPGYGLSPDGTRVFVAIRLASGEDAWQSGVLSLDGAGSITMTGPVFHGSGFGASWAPDGQSIIATDPAAQQTWLLDAAGGPGRLAAWTDPEGGSTWQRTAR